MVLSRLVVETVVIRRIFGADDLEFILRNGSSSVRKFFLEERKRLALDWVRTTQKQVRYLMDFHVKLARCAPKLSSPFEFKLAANYLCFVAVSNSLLVLLRLWGPFGVQRGISYAARAAEYFCSVFKGQFESFDAVALGSNQ